MAAHERAWRDRWVSLGLLLFGKVKDVGAFLDHGTCEVPETVPLPSDLEEQVRRYIRAIKLNGGRSLNPEDAERILAQHGEK